MTHQRAAKTWPTSGPTPPSSRSCQTRSADLGPRVTLTRSYPVAWKGLTLLMPKGRSAASATPEPPQAELAEHLLTLHVCYECEKKNLFCNAAAKAAHMRSIHGVRALAGLYARTPLCPICGSNFTSRPRLVNQAPRIRGDTVSRVLTTGTSAHALGGGGGSTRRRR